MQIRQLQVYCENIQDRLTLRIATPVNEEFRVYFTRRFLRELWPHLTAMLAGHLATRPPLEAHSDSETPGAQEQRPSFDEPFREDNPTYPLGTTPLLASEASLVAAGPGMARLTVSEARERSLNINLNADLMQALCAMLRASAEKANWDLILDYAQPASTSLIGPSGNDKPHLLH
jgi:hypothetical protein